VFGVDEFAKITGLTIEALRRYHAQGLLEPSHIGAHSGDCSYGTEKIETARLIAALEELEYSTAKIGRVLASAERQREKFDLDDPG
jgi:DNA-binding transcriptional MerR regulator